MIVSLLVVFGLTGGMTAAPALTVTHVARALQPGELVILTIVSDTALSTVDVTAFGRKLRAQALPKTTRRPHAWMAFVGLDLDLQPGNHAVSVSAMSATGASTVSHPLTVVKKAFSTRNLKVDPDFVNPPEAEAARIDRESAALAAAFEGNAVADPLSRLTFVRPVPHKANSAFGTRSIFNGEPRNAHGGADFLSPPGAPIKAPAPGKVTLADNLYFSGGTVVVDHGLGIVSLFAHMSTILVKTGDEVPQGKVLGLVGATGRVTGPHLHWTVRVNGARVDPLSFLALLPVKGRVPSQ